MVTHGLNPESGFKTSSSPGLPGLFKRHVTSSRWPNGLEALGTRMGSKLFKIEKAWQCYAFTRTNFSAQYRVYPCQDYLEEVVSARVKFRASVPYYFWFTCWKLGVPCQNGCGHHAEIWGCRAHFSARVNGAYIFKSDFISQNGPIP